MYLLIELIFCNYVIGIKVIVDQKKKKSPEHSPSEMSRGESMTPVSNQWILTFLLLLGNHAERFVYHLLSSVQFSSVTQSCPILWDLMNCSTPGLPVHHHLPESTQIRVHWVSDAIQPSHPLPSPSPPTLNLFQHQGLFK